MTADIRNEDAMLSPDEAFAVLGNETRMAILQTLGETNEPLAFSELYERVEYDTTANFSYHLEKLVGHFMAKTDEGYELRQTGRRVVEAVLSGAVTEDPVLEPTEIDEPCTRCGSNTLVAYHQERVKQYCSECPGHYAQPASTDETDETAEYGYLGSLPLPPAGVQGRTAEEIGRASWTWGLLEMLAVASGLCPRCSAPLDESVRVCEAHDAADGLCERCENRHSAQLSTRCPNCYHEQRGASVLGLMAELDLLAFLTAHEINPVSPSSQAAYDAAIMGYDEEIQSTDPLEAQFTFTVDGDRLALTVDDELNVTDSTWEDGR